MIGTLCTVEDVRLIPGMRNLAALPDAWLYRLIGAATSGAERYCKQHLACRNYVEYLSGADTPDLIVKELPLWVATSTVAAASIGAVLPQSTIFLTSIRGFPPGTGGDPNPNTQPPTVALQTGTSTWTTVTYTGLQPNLSSPNASPALTGCSGGTGTLTGLANTNQVAANVFTPVVFWDPQGNYGQNPNGFGPTTIMALGNSFTVPYPKENGLRSHQGLIRKALGGYGLGGGAQGGWGGWGLGTGYSGQGKLAGQRMAGWPRTQGAAKVLYTAGYDPRPGAIGTVPDDLRWAVAQIVVQLSRALPNGGNMSSEGLGAYSYSMVYGGDNLEIGEIRRVLASYRESSFGGVPV